MRRFYNVHLRISSEVLTDILAYAEDHGEVVRIEPCEGQPKPRPNGLIKTKTYTKSPVHIPGHRVIDVVLEYMRTANAAKTSHEIGQHIATFGYDPKSSSAAISSLVKQGFLLRLSNMSISATGKGGKPI